AARGQRADCGPVNITCDHPSNNPDFSDTWDKQRGIRAGLIRWLCTDSEAKRLVNLIWIGGAIITGWLYLYNASVPFGLSFNSCRLTQDANLMDLEVGTLDFQGCWVRSINADRARVNGACVLRGGFRADGCIRLVGAEVRDNVDCRCSTFENPLQGNRQDGGVALAL